MSSTATPERRSKPSAAENGRSPMRCIGSPLLVQRTREVIDGLTEFEQALNESASNVPTEAEMPMLFTLARLESIVQGVKEKCQQACPESVPLIKKFDQSHRAFPIESGGPDVVQGEGSRRSFDILGKSGRLTHATPRPIETSQPTAWHIQDEAEDFTERGMAGTAEPTTLETATGTPQAGVVATQCAQGTAVEASPNQSVQAHSMQTRSSRETDYSERPNNRSNNNEPWKRATIEAFDTFDKDNDGYLDKHEMLSAIWMLKHGKNPRKPYSAQIAEVTQEYVESIMKEADTSGDGKISRDEFVEVMGKAIFGPAIAERWRGAQQFARDVFLERQLLMESDDKNDSKLIHPSSVENVLFNMVVSLMAYLLIFTLPLSLGWTEYALYFRPLNIVTEIVFVLDFVKNFWTGHIDDEGTLVMEMDTARRIYVGNVGSFSLDLFGSLPFDLVFFLGMIMKTHFTVSVMKNFLRALKILRSLKLLLTKRNPGGRLYHFWRNFSHGFDSLTGLSLLTITKTSNIIYWTLITSHWVGCLQFMLVRIHGYPKDSWVVLSGLEGARPVVQWQWSIYKSLAQLINIGFETPPFTNTACDTLSHWCQLEHWITLLCLYLGVGLYTYLLSSMLFVLQTNNLCHKVYEEKLSELEVFMKQKKLDASMKENIREYFSLKYPQRSFCNDAELLRELPPNYADRIRDHLARSLKLKTPILRENIKFASILGASLEERIAVEGQIIFREHAPGDGVYFICSGTVYLESEPEFEEERIKVKIGPGCYFGEGAVLLNRKRSMSAKTDTHCSLFFVDKETFLLILKCFPKVAERMLLTAQRRLRKVQHAKRPMDVSLEPGDETGDYEDCPTSFFLGKQPPEGMNTENEKQTALEVI